MSRIAIWSDKESKDYDIKVYIDDADFYGRRVCWLGMNDLRCFTHNKNNFEGRKKE